MKSYGICLSYNPEILLVGIYLKKSRTLMQRKYKHPYVHCSITYTSQYAEATQASTNRQMDKRRGGAFI